MSMEGLLPPKQSDGCQGFEPSRNERRRRKWRDALARPLTPPIRARAKDVHGGTTSTQAKRWVSGIRAKSQRAPQAQVARCTSKISHAANPSESEGCPWRDYFHPSKAMGVRDSSQVATSAAGASCAMHQQDLSRRQSERERRMSMEGLLPPKQ